jgi:hypothetical protein
VECYLVEVFVFPKIRFADNRNRKIVVLKGLKGLVLGVENIEIAEKNYRLGFTVIIFLTALIFLG